jgi:hypothetical protein
MPYFKASFEGVDDSLTCPIHAKTLADAQERTRQLCLKLQKRTGDDTIAFGVEPLSLDDDLLLDWETLPLEEQERRLQWSLDSANPQEASSDAISHSEAIACGLGTE